MKDRKNNVWFTLLKVYAIIYDYTKEDLYENNN